MSSKVTIKDIYAGMPDAKDEITTGQEENFFASFVVPPRLPVEELLSGKKFLISGFKGVGKTSILYYLQSIANQRDSSTCSSFMYFKSDYEEVRRSNFDAIAKKMTAIIDITGEIQPNKVEYVHIWRWVFFKKIVEDSEEFSNGLFEKDENWYDFVKNVNKISFNSEDKKTISLSSLSIEAKASKKSGVNGKLTASFKRVNKDQSAFENLINIVDYCEKIFKKLIRTDVPYYIFVDEIEAFYGDKEIFSRDLTLIRDLLFTIHRINGYQKVHIIAAIRNEVLFAMDKYIQTREINKIIDGFKVPIKWSYSNTNSVDHPIIQILMKRITASCGGAEQNFYDWFPEKVHDKDTVSYILDNGWNKPRDIVRFLIAAQNDTLHCGDSFFSQAVFDTLRKEYSKSCLMEIRQELQSLYSTQEIEMVIRLLRGGSRFTTPEQIRKKALKGSEARKFWDQRQDEILEDFYRVGFWGNVNRKVNEHYIWRWNHKEDEGILRGNNWEIAIHNALCAELSISSYN